MSSLNTLIDVANLGFNIANFSQLRGIRSLAEQQALSLEQLYLLRTAVFNIKQAASQIEKETAKPIAQTAALSVLLRQISDYGISADLFPDFNDKEYVRSTFEFVTKQREECASKLDTYGGAIVEKYMHSYFTLPELEYFTNNNKLYSDYCRAKDDVQKLRNIQMVGLAVIGSTFIAMIACIIAAMSNIAPEFLVILMAAALVGEPIVLAGLVASRNDCRRIERSISEALDVKKYVTLRWKFNNDIEQAEKQIHEFRLYIDKVLDGSCEVKSQESEITNTQDVVIFDCSSCKQALESSREDVGKECECPFCKQMVTITASTCSPPLLGN